MSTLTSIVCLIVALIIVVLQFISDFKGKKWIIVISIALALVFGLWDIFNKKHDSESDKAEIKDSIKNTGTTVINKIDTNTNKVIDNSNSNTGTIVSTIKKKNTIPILLHDSMPKIQASTTVEGNNNHIVSGTGNNVGVNGDINIAKYIQQRHLTRQTLEYILSNIPDTATNVVFNLPMSDKEALNYANEIYNEMRHLGYNKMTMGAPFFSTKFDTITFHWDKNNTVGLRIHARPNIE